MSTPYRCRKCGAQYQSHAELREHRRTLGPHCDRRQSPPLERPRAGTLDQRLAPRQKGNLAA